jgi:murein DD-endopeptidase MepM/ murein hydrolase activator NlpD
LKVFAVFIAWVLLGLACFMSAPFVLFNQYKKFSLSEPVFQCPVPLANNTAILRADVYGKGFFGASRSNGRSHKGIDLKADLGAPISAAKSGRVIVAGVDPEGYGNYVALAHPDGLETRYAHLSVMRVHAGDWVRQGQVIGDCGKTGNADDPKIIPHVHYEIRYKKHALNPSSEGLWDPAVILARR